MVNLKAKTLKQKKTTYIKINRTMYRNTKDLADGIFYGTDI